MNSISCMLTFIPLKGSVKYDIWVSRMQTSDGGLELWLNSERSPKHTVRALELRRIQNLLWLNGPIPRHFGLCSQLPAAPTVLQLSHPSLLCHNHLQATFWPSKSHQWLAIVLPAPLATGPHSKHHEEFLRAAGDVVHPPSAIPGEFSGLLVILELNWLWSAQPDVTCFSPVSTPYPAPSQPLVSPPIVPELICHPPSCSLHSWPVLTPHSSSCWFLLFNRSFDLHWLSYCSPT